VTGSWPCVRCPGCRWATLRSRPTTRLPHGHRGSADLPGPGSAGFVPSGSTAGGACCDRPTGSGLPRVRGWFAFQRGLCGGGNADWAERAGPAGGEQRPARCHVLRHARRSVASAVSGRLMAVLVCGGSCSGGDGGGSCRAVFVFKSGVGRRSGTAFGGWRSAMAVFKPSRCA
jgi:hypothetical protein